MSLLAALDRRIAASQLPDVRAGLAPDAAEATVIVATYDTLLPEERRQLWREAKGGDPVARYVVRLLSRMGVDDEL